MTETPWEPPLAGTEVEHLVGALERLRTTFRWKADGLDATGLRTRIGASLRGSTVPTHPVESQALRAGQVRAVTMETGMEVWFDV